MAETNQLIVKKVRKGGDHGHHGGAWKVAYADFVTAMMAFFLLLWLLNATTEAQKSGIADYFSPAALSNTRSGAGSILGGTSLSLDSSSVSDHPTGGVLLALPTPADSSKTDIERDAEKEGEASHGPAETGEGGRVGEDGEKGENGEIDEKKFAELMAEKEDEKFFHAERELREAIEGIPELEMLSDSLVIDHTPEGLRIQIVDQDKVSMFPLGSSTMYDHTKKLIGLIFQVIEELPNKVAVSGHTDSLPYAADNGYTNWELSIDRANASRRALQQSGFPLERIARVIGMAETEPLLPEDPTNPRNRRISIVLLREAGHEPPPQTHEQTGDMGAAIERTFSPAAGAVRGD